MSDKIISWYSGYKGNEYPIVFLFHGKEKRVKRLLGTKLIEYEKTKERKREFVVETAAFEMYNIIVGEGKCVIIKVSPQRKNE